MQTIKMVLDDPADRVNKEVIALAVNLGANQRNAGTLIVLRDFLLTTHFGNLELMCEGTNMQQMVKRAVKSADPLLFKLVKTISAHDGKPKEYFVANPPVIADIVRMAKSSTHSGMVSYTFFIFFIFIYILCNVFFFLF